MIREGYYLGVDTSAYTTSLALIDQDYKVIYDLRKVLDVKKGSLGLRQQEAIFQHMKNLPELLEKIDKRLFDEVQAIAVSSRPRDIEGSYMPVFLQGYNFSRTISHLLDIPLKEFSHQEGHLGAEYKYLEKLYTSDIVSFHLSGGTTEFLLVEEGFKSLKIIGSSLDISFGKLIDRLGVYMGLKFPAGKELDKMAEDGSLLKLDVAINIKDDYYINLSGYENYFKRIIDSKKYKNEDIARTLFSLIANILARLIKKIVKNKEIKTFLMTGGVSANSHIRKDLEKLLAKSDIELYFQTGKLSSDNAVGIANLSVFL